ncbi:MAG: hypothetical protein QOD51_652, partial [Candidatus Eremiobacteraeota bacterium]|nr:hypothetical protein [Candidatus Eremiobacteraeota bacterium]
MLIATENSPTECEVIPTPASEIFGRPEFIEQPWRACHALVRRLGPSTGPETVAARFAAAGGEAEPLLRGFTLWTETLDSPADSPLSVERREREVSRSVSPRLARGRIVVLAYADGICDLIVVAHRAHAHAGDLHRIGGLLADGTPADHAPSDEPAAVAVPALGPQPISWGLGDPRHAGRTGRVPIPTVALADACPAHLVLTATAVLLARYGSASPQIAFFHARRGEAHSPYLYAPDLDDTAETGAFAAAAGRTESCSLRL